MVKISIKGELWEKNGGEKKGAGEGDFSLKRAGFFTYKDKQSRWFFLSHTKFSLM